MWLRSFTPGQQDSSKWGILLTARTEAVSRLSRSDLSQLPLFVLLMVFMFTVRPETAGVQYSLLAVILMFAPIRKQRSKVGLGNIHISFGKNESD